MSLDCLSFQSNGTQFLSLRDMDCVCNVPFNAFGAIHDLKFHMKNCFVQLIYPKWHKFRSIVRYAIKKIGTHKNEAF